MLCTANIEEVMKFSNRGNKSFETDFNTVVITETGLKFVCQKLRANDLPSS